MALPLILLALAAVAWFTRAQISDAFSFVRDRTEKVEPLSPDDCRASSEASGHPAGNACDGLRNRYWAPAAGSGAGESLEARFTEPVQLRQVIVTAGISANQDEFLSQARPARITVTLVDVEGGRDTGTIALRDQAGEQRFDVRGTDVTRVVLTIDAAYGDGPDRGPAVAEVELFGRG
ncbi:NADase-type glycan-binding domain-containing protein [Streptomyces sp. NBC_01803]|uniref:NADase-type glycan-binding domain-containing protein n=1 Tax=Streptomyces sp. NBC_01803 TaxID=2975946 RepID=UPI002DD9D7A0|nr:hypothetical protein [Streptomyces sp. NBC_01803]WSA43233.1 hypothetical protein OIE51_02905 [Streptomyces sp. NBC_01803]